MKNKEVYSFLSRRKFKLWTSSAKNSKFHILTKGTWRTTITYNDWINPINLFNHWQLFSKWSQQDERYSIKYPFLYKKLKYLHFYLINKNRCFYHFHHELEKRQTSRHHVDMSNNEFMQKHFLTYLKNYSPVVTLDLEKWVFKNNEKPKKIEK